MKLHFERPYHKNYKKYSKNSRWQKFVFKGQYQETGLSSFNFVLDHFIKDKSLPTYFKSHHLSGVPTKIRKQVARKIGGIRYQDLYITELHFNGPSSDMLLVYVRCHDIIDVLDIGTHADINKLLRR